MTRTCLEAWRFGLGSQRPICPSPVRFKKGESVPCAILRFSPGFLRATCRTGLLVAVPFVLRRLDSHAVEKAWRMAHMAHGTRPTARQYGVHLTSTSVPHFKRRQESGTKLFGMLKGGPGALLIGKKRKSRRLLSSSPLSFSGHRKAGSRRCPASHRLEASSLRAAPSCSALCSTDSTIPRFFLL